MSAYQLERCRGWLEPALAAGRDYALSYADIIDLVADGQAQIWPGECSALLTQLIRTEEGGRIHVWLGGGSLRDLMNLRPGVEAWGRSQGCTHATIDGRAGWAWMLREHGFRPVDGELRKELVNVE